MTKVLGIIGHKSADSKQPLTFVVVTFYGGVTFTERFENQQLLENVRHEGVETNKSHVLKILVSCQINIWQILIRWNLIIAFLRDNTASI